MPQRVVRQPLATYINPDGATRYGLAGETVTVHPSHVKEFDAANGGAPAPKRRPAKPKR